MSGSRAAENTCVRVSRRPSGGRGEYEISDNTETGITPVNLLERRLIFDLGGGTIVDTNSTLRRQGGKRRIRLLTRGGIHPHRQLAAALMMPKAVREDTGWGRGAPVMRTGQYSIEHIYIVGADVSARRARLKIGDIELRNATYGAERLTLATRLEQVRALWRGADDFPDTVKELLASHRALVTRRGAISAKAEGIITRLQEIVTERPDEFGIQSRSKAEDIVPDLLKSLNWSQHPPEAPPSVDDVVPEEVEIRQRIIKDWKRWATFRGMKSAKFRREVRAAYDSTCIVCGLHLPPTPPPLNSAAGVDAAHILPWADYDLDEISNGVCLCKHHHWAFDEGLLLIMHDGQEYRVEVPADTVTEIRQNAPRFSIDELRHHAGPIPEARLPARPADRPRPQFLRMFAEKLRADGA